jgi:hypothetical protein
VKAHSQREDLDSLFVVFSGYDKQLSIMTCSSALRVAVTHYITGCHVGRNLMN